MNNIFTKHPHSVGETYLEHMLFALKFGFGLLWGGVACIIHSVFTFWFQKTGSTAALDSVEMFLKRMKTNDEKDKALIRILEERKKLE